MSKRVVVIQSNYVPWKGYFDLIHDADAFVFYDEVKYTKNDWRNRNRIYTANGLQWLTVPIPKKAVRLKISEVAIEDTHWQRKHFNSLYFGYRSAPWFPQVESFLEQVYLERQWTRLIDLNRYLIREICARIGIETEFLDSADFELDGERVERLLSLLVQLGATEYLSGPTAREYLEPYAPRFTDAGIELRYKDYRYPTYRQSREPFVHQVSILDLLVHLPLDRVGESIWG